MSDTHAQLSRRILTGAVSALLIKVGAAGASYVVLFVLARWMGPAEFGRYALGFSLATLFGIIFSSGQAQAPLRLIPEHLARNENGLALGAHIAGMRVSAGAGVLGGLLFAAIVGLISVAGFHIDTMAMLAAAVLIPPIAIARYWSSTGRSMGHIVLAMLPQDIVWRVLVAGVAGFLWLHAIMLTGTSILLWSAGLLTLVVGIQALLTQHELPLSMREARPVTDYRYWRHVWLTFWLATSLAAVLNQIDVALIGVLIKSEEAGLYLAAMRTAKLLSLVLVGVNAVVAPLCSRYFYAGDMKGLQTLFRIVAPGLLLAGLGGVLFFAFFGQSVLGLFGARFVAMQDVLIVLSAGAAVGVLCGPVGMMMLMTGRQVVYIRFLAAAAAVSVVFQTIGIVELGVLGAALGNCAAQLVWNVGLWLYILHTTGIDASAMAIFHRPRAGLASGSGGQFPVRD
jgi:O-antigen/teichoic acid export membrane protein